MAVESNPMNPNEPTHPPLQANHAVTEDDIANFLLNTPDFFERHAELLASVLLTSPHGQRAVSLQERQAELLREKIRLLEQRIMDMIRHGNENVIISGKLHRWACGLFAPSDVASLPQRLTSDICTQFAVPQGVIKVWGANPTWAGCDWAQGASDDAQAFASSLTAPYCGVNVGFEASTWLPDPGNAQSMALIPLREGPISAPTPAFGMLVLASSDVQRFQTDMGTDFLDRIAELASAVLGRVR
jgi:uncharacterized protein